MYTEEKVLVETTITDDGAIFTHEITNVFKDGELIASTHHRGSFTPTIPIEELPEAIRDIASLRWTKLNVAAYIEKQNIYKLINIPEASVQDAS